MCDGTDLQLGHAAVVALFAVAVARRVFDIVLEKFALRSILCAPHTVQEERAIIIIAPTVGVIERARVQRGLTHSERHLPGEAILSLRLRQKGVRLSLAHPVFHTKCDGD